MKKEFDWQNAEFETAFLKWLESTKHTLQKSTYDGYYRYALRIVKYFSCIKIKDIVPTMIEDYYNYLRKNSKISENTIRHYHAIIYKFFKYTYYRGITKDNPADKIEKPKIKKYNSSFYTVEQSKKLLACVYNTSIMPAVVLALMFGMRRSEICGLRFCDIDFKNNLIYIKNKVVKININNKKELFFSDELKSHSSKRVLPMKSNIKLYFLELYKNKKDTDFVYSRGDKKQGPADPDTLSRKFADILKKNNLPKIRFHELRHSCASILINNGVPIKFVQDWLGHSSYQTTADIYGHLYNESKFVCSDLLNNVLLK